MKAETRISLKAIIDLTLICGSFMYILYLIYLYNIPNIYEFWGEGIWYLLNFTITVCIPCIFICLYNIQNNLTLDQQKETELIEKEKEKKEELTKLKVKEYTESSIYKALRSRFDADISECFKISNELTTVYSYNDYIDISKKYNIHYIMPESEFSWDMFRKILMVRMLLIHIKINRESGLLHYDHNRNSFERSIIKNIKNKVLNPVFSDHGVNI